MNTIPVKNDTFFEKVFSRDFSLATLEIYYRCESSGKKPWLKKTNPYHPYIIYRRIDGTVHIYYHQKGVAWTQEVLKERVKKDYSFLQLVEKKVTEGIRPIQKIYETGKSLDKKKLQRFINQLIEIYPWIEAMWWLYKATKEDLGGADNHNLQRVRKKQIHYLLEQIQLSENLWLYCIQN